MSDRQAGYFRIGFVELAVPPTGISTQKIQNAEEYPTLRAAHVMYRPTGQSRWDATIQWKAMIETGVDGSRDYSDWDDLTDIVAMMRAAPFVEVENDYLRQSINSDLLNSGPMVMALRQLTIATNPDLTDTLDCTLQMTLFNYLPYSSNFAYLDSNGNSVPRAIDSVPFRQYIDNWKTVNLPDGWRSLQEGLFAIRWRRYVGISMGLDATTAVGQGLAAAPVPAAALSLNSGKVPRMPNLPANIKTLCDKYAGQYGVDAAVIEAMCAAESGGKANQVSAKGAQGYMQLMPATAAGLGVTNSQDPEQNIEAGTRYFKQQLDQFGSYALALSAYNAGPNTVKNGKIPAFRETQDYVTKIMTWSGRASELNQNPTPLAFGPVASHATTIQPIPAVSSHAPTHTTTDTHLMLLKQQMWNQGWTFDHNTSDTAFFFQEDELALSPETSTIENPFFMYPVSVTVVLVNNLAQIPLAAYQYPTYQHVGPATGMVSVSFQSVGARLNESDEPQHPGLQVLSQASDQMQEQFLRMRTAWRSVSSVHRMQAFFVRNQILNLAGVEALLLRSIDSTTLPDSSDTIEVQLTGFQYDNVFEMVSPYQVHSVPGNAVAKATDLILGSAFDSLNDQEQASLSELKNIRDHYQKAQVSSGDNSSWVGLAKYVIGQAEDGIDVLTGLQSFDPVRLSSADQKTLLQVLNNPGPATGKVRDHYPGLATWMKGRNSSSNLTQLEALVLGNLGKETSMVPGVYDNILASINAQLRAADDGAQASSKVAETYRKLVPSLLGNNVLAQRQMEQLIDSPLFKNTFKGASGTPSGDAVNQNHGAYMDMGLTAYQINGKNVSPAMYLSDTSAILTAKMQDLVSGALKEMQASSLGAATHGAPSQAQSVFPENAQALLERIRLTGYSMAFAYPTFKLFFMEEDNSGLFYCFDDFYSYASAISFEIIRSQDGNELAVIRLNNLAHLLSHKLFDMTQMGRWERAQEPYLRPMEVDSSGQPIGGPGAGEVSMGKGLFGGSYQEVPGRDLSEGIAKEGKKIPLQYIPLQTGTKIQIRMGSTNDPDLLTPVFAGVVAELTVGDVIEIRAQGFSSELEQSDFGNAKTYGGFWRFWSSGAAGSVLQDLVDRAEARHYGHWQINGTKPSALSHGFDWSPLAAAPIGIFSSRAGNLVKSAWNRSGENILLNHVIRADGSTADARARFSIYDEDPINWLLFTPSYSVPDNLNRSIWHVMRDIARRYPGYVLATKPYGFPYGCDATLVFGHPLDVYYSRPPLPGDAEVEQGATHPSSAAIYSRWWSQQGKQQLTDAVPAASKAAATGAVSSASSEELSAAQSSPTALRDTLTRIWNRLMGGIGGTEFEATLGKMVFPATSELVRAELDVVWRSWLSYYDNAVAVEGGHLGLRIAPLTRTHLVDEQSIIYNGIQLNENLYNAVRIKQNVFKANDFIHDQYINLLDATERIVNPEENVVATGLSERVAMSFLRDELGQMYRGDLILRGSEKISPWDTIVLSDPSTATVGTIEVETVIHAYNLEEGFITIVKPRAVVTANEKVSGDVYRRIAMFYNSARQELFGQQPTDQQLYAGLAGLAAADAGIYAVGELLGGPAAWLATAALLIGSMLWLEGKYQTMAPIRIFPLQRYGRMWVGGLQGYRIGDIKDWFGNKYTEFLYNEIWPTLELFRQKHPDPDWMADKTGYYSGKEGA